MNRLRFTVYKSCSLSLGRTSMHKPSSSNLVTCTRQDPEGINPEFLILEPMELPRTGHPLNQQMQSKVIPKIGCRLSGLVYMESLNNDQCFRLLQVHYNMPQSPILIPEAPIMNLMPGSTVVFFLGCPSHFILQTGV